MRGSLASSLERTPDPRPPEKRTTRIDLPDHVTRGAAGGIGHRAPEIAMTQEPALAFKDSGDIVDSIRDLMLPGIRRVPVSHLPMHRERRARVRAARAVRAGTISVKIERNRRQARNPGPAGVLNVLPAVLFDIVLLGPPAGAA